MSWAASRAALLVELRVVLSVALSVARLVVSKVVSKADKKVYWRVATTGSRKAVLTAVKKVESLVESKVA